MKKQLLIYLMLIVAGSVTGQNYKWIPLNSGVSDGNLFSIDFPTDLVGYAVGHNGTDNYVLKTTDGGQSWTNKANSSLEQLVVSCDFIDENIGFVACLNGGVFMTKDGGNTWSKGFTGSNANMTNISFPNETTGYMCSNSGRFFKTTTGGIGWQVNAININDDLVYIKFFGSKKGVTVASSGRVWKTLDGGNTWDTINLDRDRVLFAHFLEENVGFVCGVNGVVKRTVNGGINWSNGTTVNHKNRDWEAIYFYETNHGFVGGEKANIMFTENGGSSWSMEHGDTTETIHALVTTPVGHIGYAVGSNGMILKRKVPASIGEEEPLHAEISLTQDGVKITVAEPGQYFVRIMNMNGKILSAENYFIESSQTLTTDLPAGIYMAYITHDKHAIIHKFLNF